ncbi:MAG: DUF115 domain-containing protein [Treponema sp.]|jgi:hypothetical protein|nr:DUF115 domain-containing protein [Treponema sp.]
MENRDTPQELPARRGSSLSYKGKTLLSRIDPISQAERLIENLDTKDRTLYFCPSPLYGYGLARLLEKLKDNSAILCAEADDLLFDLTRNAIKDLLDNEDRLFLVKIDELPETSAKLCSLVHNTWGEKKFRRVELLQLNGGWQLFPELYEKTAAVLRKDLAVSWSNAMTLIRLGRLYIKNAIKNLPLISELRDITALDFGADPMLVLGAGPSMDIILDELKKFYDTAGLRDRPFRIICADTCIPSLKERNIEPDLAVILESQHWNLSDFSGSRGWNVSAAADLSALPSSIRILGGETFLFFTPWTELRLLKRLEEAGLLPCLLAPLGSVGLSAVQLAIKCGRGPVIIAGLDFSFTADAYHARSSPGHQARLMRGTRFYSLPNVQAAFREGTFAAISKSGLPVRSDPALRNYRNLFEEEFSSSTRLYEMQGPGLKLGVKKLSPEEAIKKLTLKGQSCVSSFPEKSKEKQLAQRQVLEEFIKNEKAYLIKLRDILTGQIPAQEEETENLLEICDYLWAHFPESAAAGGRRPGVDDLSFLKRVRTEIDPFIKLWDMSL